MRPDFAHPWFLLAALLALPALWWSRRSAGRVVFSSLRALPLGGQTWRTRIAWMPDVMLALAVVALAIAIAGPRAGDKTSRIRREGIAVMMAVDISGSMRALDLSQRNRELTRLDAVKQVFEQFVLGGGKLAGRPDDAIGLVAFARYAETRSPLTLDHGNLVTAARSLDFAPEGEDGTAIGAGLELAVQRLAEFTTRSRIAILLTDGESNVHEINEDTAIEDAIKAGIKVYTIGAGTNGIAPVRVDVGGGRTELMQTQVSIDEATLRKIADKTGGQYFRATDNASLARIYAQIDKLERATFEEERFSEYHQFYPWFVGLAMALVVLAFLLRGTVLRRLP
ncbi:MAG: VWA domain-containing protein [Deltaproteobacteria bacterium]|nr:VWA domain-containing protein [Deltaproteobacteria bacterium]MDQ3297799.1 VWA domain-containing protein [Myxococcota bacterium]